jgi:hypothetical protein
MDHLSFADDPVLSYTPTQLRYHEVPQALLANPPLEGVEERIWSHWLRNELFHINAIYRLGLEARTQAGSNLPPVRVEHPASPIVVDTDQLGPTSTPGVNL